MNTWTKTAVNVSVLAAGMAELCLATSATGPIWVASLVTLVAALAAGFWRPGPARAGVLCAVYLAPAAFLVWLDAEYFSMETVWLLPLLALLLMDRGAWRWSLPSPWRAPLVAWALLVAFTWPIVALREISFSWAMLFVRGAATSSIGISPGEAAAQVVNVALVHTVGLLWIDALFRWYAASDGSAFRRQVLLPLGATALVACLVGAYQGFVNVSFMSGHLWPYMGRAAGTLADANAFGTIAALWAPGLVALSYAVGGRRWMPLAAGTFAVAAIGTYVSGSRTALVAIGIGAAAVLHERWIAHRAGNGAPVALGRRVLAIAALLVAMAALVGLVARFSSITTIADRGVFERIPGLGDGSVTDSIRELWQRFGYGAAAMRMIGDHPVVGVGVGGFYILVPDYGNLVTHRGPLAPDNAQNWYRHLLAELGLLGSLPWIAWTLLFARTLVRRASSAADPTATRLLRGPLLAMGVISLLGVPGQLLAVVLTFWTFVFWFLSARQAPGTPADATDRTPAWTWALVLALVLAHGGLTYLSARGDLLPRHRAERFGWIYQYGISGLETSPDGLDRRWTDERALTTIPVRGRALEFVAWVEHPDADEHPVHLRVIADGRLVFDGQLRRANAVTLEIPARPGAKTMVLETSIDRTFRPSDYGSRDRRRLGLAIRDWRWHD